MTLEPNPLELLDADGWPLDWKTETTFRGFSRSASNRRYFVRLSALGAQFFITGTTTQLDAAKLYDLALWKLAHFITRSLKPNFPDVFSSLTQTDVDNYCPALNQLYSKCAAAARLDDTMTERELREAALARTPVTNLNSPAPEAFSKYQKLIDKTRVHNIATVNKVRRVRLQLDFRKLPEVSRVSAEYESVLDRADVLGRELQSLLTSHAELYKTLAAI